MKNNHTHIAFILDRSGSMSSIASEAIGGLNVDSAYAQQFDNTGVGVHEAMSDSSEHISKRRRSKT